MATSIPADMQDFIDTTIGHQDYAPYVLDGQGAEIGSGEDDWHDVLVIEFRSMPLLPRIIKFTRFPNGMLSHHDPFED